VSNINNETKTGETYIWILLDFAFDFVVAAFFVGSVGTFVGFVAFVLTDGTGVFVVAAAGTFVGVLAFDVVDGTSVFFVVAASLVVSDGDAVTGDAVAASANTHIVTTNANFHKQFILTYNTWYCDWKLVFIISF